jgi:hypothetical protein
MSGLERENEAVFSAMKDSANFSPNQSLEIDYYREIIYIIDSSSRERSYEKIFRIIRS